MGSENETLSGTNYFCWLKPQFSLHYITLLALTSYYLVLNMQEAYLEELHSVSII